MNIYTKSAHLAQNALVKAALLVISAALFLVGSALEQNSPKSSETGLHNLRPARQAKQFSALTLKTLG